MQKVFLVILVLEAMLFIITAGDIEGAAAMLIVTAVGVPGVLALRNFTEEKDLITEIFLIGLSARLALGFIIWYFGIYKTFGPDALAYDYNGMRLVNSWSNPELASFDPIIGRSGYGMIYLTAGFYWVFGQSILIVQSFCAVIGALTAPIVYFCAYNIFENKRVAKYAAYGVALFPSFIIWSSQLLKDGLIIFLLVFIMTMLLQLQKKLSYSAALALLFGLLGILTLRFYIFYMVVVAAVGSFVIGLSPDGRSIARNFIVIMVLGIGFGYFGVGGSTVQDFSVYANLEQIQMRREALSRGADSGFVGDTDITTAQGALTALPLGFAYLAFAPFPWQVSKLSQALVIPETLFWWCLIPFMVLGIGWTLRNRLRKAIPILIFSMMLTAAYTIFQGNVGMAYRQRTQIQVFVFIFVAVGVTLRLEKRENAVALNKAQRKKQIRHMNQRAEAAKVLRS